MQFKQAYVMSGWTERQIDANEFVVVTVARRVVYLEIIRNRSLLLAGCSGNAAWICLSLALISIVKWKANLIQLLFSELN